MLLHRTLKCQMGNIEIIFTSPIFNQETETAETLLFNCKNYGLIKVWVKKFLLGGQYFPKVQALWGRACKAEYLQCFHLRPVFLQDIQESCGQTDG